MGLFNRTPDTELQISSSTAVTTTASTIAVSIPSVGCGSEDLGIMFNVTAVAGTFDASNYYTVEVLASETISGTYYSVTNDILNAVGTKLVGFNSRQIVEAVGSQNAACYKLTVTKVGSTATGVTLSAYFTKGL